MNNPIDREVAVFSAARRLPAGARSAYLNEACAGDAALRQRVEELLQFSEEAGAFLQQPAPGAQRPADALTAPNARQNTAAPGEKVGDRIGRYKLLQQIGQGGCGAVYMAEQEEPVHRRVALKVIKLGMDTKQVIARFEAERQVLALMDHPNIAKVLEAGATDTGRPYFVMELVCGIKITDYCDEYNLPTAERLDLFIKVSQAVQHAHQKGIIHRDIKPSNILVADHDGLPVPKIIDFGIAKATTDQRLTDKTLFTAFEQFIGTPAYMSPEQARMSGLDIDTRSDIYSLGVLLYELLTGKTPFDTHDLLAAGLDEMRRTISEKEPVKPSTRLAQELVTADVRRLKHSVHQPSTIDHQPSEERASSRRLLQMKELIHLLRGDLDWIVMKALEKDRTRRYETANGLAMDIQRYLKNEPVVARPPSNRYRFQKLVRRNKLAFAAAAAISTVLVLGVVVSTWEAVRATRSEREQSRLREAAQKAQTNEAELRQKAEADEKKAATEAAKAIAVSEFLQEMLRSANPDNLKGSDYSVRQLLDDFSIGLSKQLAEQPEVEATVLATIGNAYDRLGVNDKAEPLLKRALWLRRTIYGEQSDEVAQSLIDHALNLSDQTRLSEAEPEAQQALDIYRKRGSDPEKVIHALWVLQGIWQAQARFKEVTTAADEALALARNSPQRDFPEIANMIHAKADVELNQAKYLDAENLALEAVEMHRRLQGADHPETAWSLLVLGKALRGQHKLAEAERALQEALDTFLKYYSFQDMGVQIATRELRAVLEAKGDSTGLEALARRELDDANRRIESSKADAEAWVTRGLDDALHNQWKAAIQDCEEVIKISKDQNVAQRNATRIEYPMNLGRSECRLAAVLRAGGQRVYAEDMLCEALQIFNQAARNFPSEPSPREEEAFSRRSLADLLNELGRVDEAARELWMAVDLYAALKAIAPLNASYCQEEAYSTGILATLLEGAGRLDAAEAEYGRAIALYEKASADFPNQTVLTEGLGTIKLRLVELLRRRERSTETKPL